MRHRSAPRAGICLVECLVFIVLLSTVLALSAVCFRDVIALGIKAERLEKKSILATRLLKTLSDAVHQSDGFLSGAGVAKAGRDALILSTQGRARVFAASDDRLRETLLVKGAPEPIRSTELEGVRLTFDYEGGAPKSARWVVVTVRWRPDEGRAPERGIVFSLRLAPRVERGRS